MEKAQRIKEINEAEVPLRQQYDAKKSRRHELRQQIEELTKQEVSLIHELHGISDQLEALRIEKQNLERPPRLVSRQRMRG